MADDITDNETEQKPKRGAAAAAKAKAGSDWSGCAWPSWSGWCASSPPCSSPSARC